MFALPYVVSRAGWGVGVFYLAAAAFVMALMNLVYAEALRRRPGGRFLGIVRQTEGKFGFAVAFAAVAGGLALVLAAYIVLGASFVKIIFPGAGELALPAVWLLGSLPLMAAGEVGALEAAGSSGMILVVALAAAASDPVRMFQVAPAADWRAALVPFGAMIFALGSWTAVEPLVEAHRRGGGKWRIAWPIGLGAALAAAVYFVFIDSVIGASRSVSPDSLAGIVAWPLWLVAAMGALGFLAIWTSYVPTALELFRGLAGDLRWREPWPLVAVLGLPLALAYFASGNFLAVVKISGGIFIGLQYVFLARAAGLVLRPGPALRAGLAALQIIFLAAAAYEAYDVFARFLLK